MIKRGKKTQAAMEFLFTYSWSILILLIILSTVSFSVFKYRECSQDFQITDNRITIIDHKIMSNDSIAPKSKNLFYFVLKNNLPQGIGLNSIKIKKDGLDCGSFNFPLNYELAYGSQSNVIQGNISNPLCYGETDSCYNLDVEINYKDGVTGINKVLLGELHGGFSSLSDTWNLGSFTRTNFGGSIVQNKNGQKLNICNPESPPLNLTTLLSPGITTWDLPNECNTNGVAQVGFANACTVNATQLAKGWVHNTLYVDPIFSNNKIYLGGNAVYYDTITGQTKTNGICMNDNLYFYVNGVLKYKGGTTGVMVGNVSTYQAGDEVLRNCGNCQQVDSSAWCIPAFELTTAGFNFGQQNNIDILVEDFCRGDGQQHAGGMSSLSITLV